MPLQFHESDQYIMDAADYIGIDDAYELELERVAFYGLQALNTAAKIRGKSTLTMRAERAGCGEKGL